MTIIKIMIISIATLLLTWIGFGLIAYLLAEPEITFKSAMKKDIVVFLMFVIGYLPALIVTLYLFNKSNL